MCSKSSDNRRQPDIGDTIEFRERGVVSLFWRLGKVRSRLFIKGKLKTIEVAFNGRLVKLAVNGTRWRWPISLGTKTQTLVNQEIT